MITADQVLEALSHVNDPDLKKDLVTLKMIRDVKVDGKKISFTVVLTTPACPLKEKIKSDCVQAIREHIDPAADPDITMTSDVTASRQAPKLESVKNIIAVISGKGGVGKSTVAVNLAVALAQTGARTALVDADIYGPSIPIMFNMMHERPNVIEKDGQEKMEPLLRYGVKLQSIGFLIPPDQALVWRGPMAAKALSQLIFDTDWGAVDYLILDMPPGTGDLHLSLVQSLPVTGVVVVTTPQAVALADARKGAQMFQDPKVNVPVLGVIENMSYFSPPDMPEKKYFIFGSGGGEKIASEIGTVVLGHVPMEEKIREDGDNGSPVALENSPSGKAFARIAEEVARQIAIRNTGLPPTEKVEILYR